MSFKSAVGSTYSGAFSTVVSQEVDVAGKVSATSGTLTIPAPPAGKYILSSSFLGTSQGGSFTSVLVGGTASGVAFDVDKQVLLVGAGLSEYRSSGCVIIDCNGISDVVVSLTCGLSAGTWTFKEGSYIEVARLA
jgi:hypothetical protein